jgi:site-specific DNA recombinase
LNYISSQRHEGWIALPDRYDDGGFSGGNMERPAIKRLFADIEQGLIDVVVVYKIDRLSRSIADFVRLMEFFEKHSVVFVSVTQSFNTQNSMGKLMLNILLSFAQFEREVTSERIRDKIAASKKKGMYMGGQVPLGYDVVDKKLKVNIVEAETIRFIYEEYYRTLSPLKVVKALDAQGLRTKTRVYENGKTVGGKKICTKLVYDTLNNPIHTHPASRGVASRSERMRIYERIYRFFALQKCERYIAARCATRKKSMTANTKPSSLRNCGIRCILSWQRILLNALAFHRVPTCQPY